MSMQAPSAEPSPQEPPDEAELRRRLEARERECVALARKLLRSEAAMARMADGLAPEPSRGSPSRVERMKARRAEDRKRIKRLRARLAKAEEARAGAGDAGRETERLRAELRGAQRETLRLRAERDAASASLREAHARMTALENSRIWRLTRPLRDAVGRWGRGRPRGDA